MEPFTFGMVFVSTVGGALTFIAMLGNAGVKINETALVLAMESVKFGMLLWLMHKLYTVFL